MKRHVIAIVVFALAAALTFTLWGTLKGVASAHRTTGTVVGTFRIVGGPPPGINMAIRGTAIFIPNLKSQGAPVKVAVNSTGDFSFRLPMGIWKVTAQSPQDNDDQPALCGSLHPITVNVDQITHVAVLCEVP